MNYEVILINVLITILTSFITARIALGTRNFDHKRSRRKNTIELMQLFAREHKENPIQRRLLMSLFNDLTSEQCSRIWYRKEVKIHLTNKELLLSIFEDDEKINKINSNETYIFKRRPSRFFGCKSWRPSEYT